MTYGNLAYEYDYRAYKTPEKNRETVKKQKTQENIQNRKDNQKNTNNKGKTPNSNISYFSKIAAVIVIAASAIFMIVQFVEVNETLSELEKIQSEYNFEEAATSQMAYELEQSIDLSKIEEEATSRLGMKRPDANQIIYVDVKQDDVTEKTVDEVEGFSNRASGFFKSLISNIVEFFSI